jgi:hypothetical protein
LTALADDAWHAEKEGNWDTAKRRWENLAEPSSSDDEDARVWRLLAAWRIEELEGAPEFDKSVGEMLRNSLQSGEPLKTEEEQKAARGLAFEDLEDWGSAQQVWAELKDRKFKDRKGEEWILLAQKHLRETKAQKSSSDDKAIKHKAIKAALARAQKDEKANPVEAGKTYLKIGILYLDDDDPEVRKLIDPIRASLKGALSPRD